MRHFSLAFCTVERVWALQCVNSKCTAQTSTNLYSLCRAIATHTAYSNQKHKGTCYQTNYVVVYLQQIICALNTEISQKLFQNKQQTYLENKRSVYNNSNTALSAPH